MQDAEYTELEEEKIKMLEIFKEVDELVILAIKIERDAIITEIKKELAEVMLWHKKTFKDVTVGGQLLKLEEEYKELAEAVENENGDETFKELADVFIVCAGLVRLGSIIGKVNIEAILDKMDIEELYNTLEAIRAKMEINRARKWDKLKDGRFKHK